MTVVKRTAGIRTKRIYDPRNETAVEQLCDLPKLGRGMLLYGAHDTAYNDALVLANYIRDHLQGAHGHRAA
jgi:hypothetical protein